MNYRNQYQQPAEDMGIPGSSPVLNKPGAVLAWFPGLQDGLDIPLRNLREKEGEMIPIERIRNVDIFQGLKDEELRIASQYCQEEKVLEGTTLCEEGNRADKLFILEEGTVSIRFKKGVHFEIHGPGKILGWSFLVPPNRYTASAITVTPSKVLTIKSPDFYELVHRDAKMGLRIMDNLSQVVSGRLKAFVDYY